MVPWPSDLAPDLELADAPDGAIGLADDPERQRVLPLRHGFADAVVAYAGVSGTGHHGALSTTAARLALDHSPDDLHIYGIDLVGEGLALIGGLPHVGAVATRDDATALRIVAHLTTEAAQRRGAIARAGYRDEYFEATPETLFRMLRPDA